MIIGLYSDPHISYTSSIMPLSVENSKYTCRLNMLINSFKWMYEQFDKEHVDVICNCGDTFNSHTLKSEEITAFSECLSYSKGTPEIHIIGNHDMFNKNFYSNSFVRDYSFIELYDRISKVNDVISVIPYTKASDVNLSELNNISNKVVLSHLDLKGSHLRPDFIMDSGFDPEYLDMNFEASFNGHIHTGEKLQTSSNLVVNVGSLVSNSFSDSNTYIPNICIYNTDTKEFKRIVNPNAILFRKINCDSVTELLNKISKMNKSFKHIIRITCPFKLKDEVKDIISKEDFIISSRVVTTIEESSIINSTITEEVVFNNSAIKDKFSEFINNNHDLLKYPISVYNQVLSDLEDK